MHKTSKVVVALVGLAPLLAALLHASALQTPPPSITAWSSSGGTTQNKSGPQDTMYLAQAGDSLTFSVTVNQAVAYEWTVNKAVQASTSSTLTWTVPAGGGIWEVHMRASNANGEAHLEWVVSTLSASEAPAFFESFTDGAFLAGRTALDPWNRTLPTWTRYPGSDPYDASRGSLRRISGSINDPMNTDVGMAYGTWKFRYRFPAGGAGSVYFNVGVNNGFWSYQRLWTYAKESTTHHHTWVAVPRPAYINWNEWSLDYDGTGFVEDDRWHEVTVIRTPENRIYFYNDAIFEFYARDGFTGSPMKLFVAPERNGSYDVHLDGFECHENRYLFPAKSATYGPYTWNYRREMDSHYYPETRDGIVVRGRGVRLSEIASLLGDPSRFAYDAGTRTATCRADLVIHDSAELVMRDETLLFDGSADGERHFVPRYGSRLDLERSTIGTTNGRYFVWNNAGSTTHFGRPFVTWLEPRMDPIEFQRVLGPILPLGNACAVDWTMEYCTIDNAAHIFLDSPTDLNLRGTRFTNLREVDVGNYQAARPERLFSQGDKSFWVHMDEVNTERFELRGLSFSAAGSPISVTFATNGLRDKVNVYDLDLDGQNAVIRKSLPQSHGQSHTWEPYLTASYQGTGQGMDSRLGLVNCRFANLDVATDKAWGIVRHYLDVKVVDRDGNPIDGATVTVTNEVDDAAYPAENIEHTRPVFDPVPSSSNQYAYLSYQLIHGQAHRSAATGADGHTPLPADRANTFVIADYVQDQAGRTSFTHRIEVSKDGQTASIAGFDVDDTWYRPDPATPTKTVVCNLDDNLWQIDGSPIPPPPPPVPPPTGGRKRGRCGALGIEAVLAFLAIAALRRRGGA